MFYNQSVKTKRKKVFKMKLFLKSFIIIGFSLLYISASSLDANTITFSMSLLLCLLSLCLMSAGIIGLCVIKERRRKKIALAKKSRAKALKARNIAVQKDVYAQARKFELILEV